MAWAAITADEVMQEWNSKEIDLLAKQQGAVQNLDSVLQRAVLRVRGAIAAGGYPLGPEGTDAISQSTFSYPR